MNSLHLATHYMVHTTSKILPSSTVWIIKPDTSQEQVSNCRVPILIHFNFSTHLCYSPGTHSDFNLILKYVPCSSPHRTEEVLMLNTEFVSSIKYLLAEFGPILRYCSQIDPINTPFFLSFCFRRKMLKAFLCLAGV